jgi:tetratricopeptide (TPR) repeat protein/predicted Ser/Thr protein kinase
MDDRKQKVEELFQEAIGLQLSARAKFLERECGGDDTLRRDVEELLSSANAPTEVGRSPGRATIGSPGVFGAGGGGDRATKEDPVLAEGTSIGDFRIRGLLGEGAMGQVYLAHDVTLGRRVALKLIKRAVMQSGGLDRFLEEARATASFNHPHIVTLYAVGEHDGRPYLALEYIDGQSLRQRAAAGRMTTREALQCCRAVAEAIAEAHRRGVVHADLKPENIVIPNDGRVRVVDFGLAKLARGAANATSGTPAYMAPERWRGAPPTGAIDIWALGVMLHELLTGVRPISDEVFLQVMFAADVIELPHLPDDAPWAPLVRECLARDPAERPLAEEVVHRLTTLLDAHAAAAAPDVRPAGAAAQPQQLVTELAADEVRLARGIMLALVGPDGAHVRRRRSELLDGAPAGSREAVGQLIDRLVDRRLVLATRDGEGGDTLLEVAHETPATAWPQLARWLGETPTRRLRLAFSARNIGPPSDAWLVPVVERMVRRSFRDREDRRFHVVERKDDATWIELAIARAGDQLRIDALHAAEARILASASASSVAGAVHALAGLLMEKLGAGLGVVGPDAGELEAMHRLGATSVELFRRYSRVLHALHATSLPDRRALATATRGIIAEDPMWAHPYALLAIIEGQTTYDARDALASARATASAKRDPSGMQLIGALEQGARGELEAALQTAGEVLQRDETELLAGTLLARWARLAQRTEEVVAITGHLHARFPELGFGMELAEVLRREGRDGDADRVIREWIATAPDSILARVELVRIEANAGRLGEARERAREVLAIHGDRDDALPELFEALVASDQISGARAIADRMLAGTPLVRARGRYRVAVTAVLEGRFAAAYDAVRRAIAEHRAFGWMSEITQCLELARSIALLVANVGAQRRYTEELAVAFETVIGDPGAAAATRFELALLDPPARRGEAPSIDEHLASLEEGPLRDVARRRMLRAAALASVGSPEEAVAAGFSAFEENTASLVALGLCAWRVRELELARRSLERAARRSSIVSSNQGSPYHAVLARFHLASVLAELGEHAAARGAYEAFLRCWADPDRPIPEVAAARKVLDVAPPPPEDEVQLVEHDSDMTSAEASQLAEAQPFEGRRETMATLIHSACAATAARAPTLVTICADVGIGKTRLAAALHQALTEAVPGGRVLAFRGQDPSVSEVDGTIRAILRRLASPAGSTLRRRKMREHLQAQVGDTWPAVALTLGWLGRDAPELRPLAGAPGALRIATVEAAARLLRRAAEQAPLCVIVDDAHLADATALDAIELATMERGGPVPLWICVLVKPSFDALRPAWGERAARAEELELAPLPDAAAEELCRALLHPAENLPARVIEMITARAHGNAMVLAELCRALKTEGIVRQERSGAWILETDRVDAWPHTPRLTWLAERELRRLPPDLAGHAQLAALLGPKFPAADMLGVLKVLGATPAARRFPLEPMAALAQLEKAQILTVRRNCEFRSAMLCEAVRESIPAPLRAELHRAAFQYYRELRQVPEERRRPRLAFHAAEAGLREPAAQAYEALAAEYLYRHRYVEAEGSFSRMLALVDSAPRRLAALHGRGLARYRTGRYEDALDDLHQARALAAEVGDRRAELTILLDEAAVLDWMWSHRRSAELVEQAIALAGDEPDPVLAARLATGRARSLWRLGKSGEAHASLREAVARAEAAGGDAYESLIISLVMLGTVLCGLGELRQAREVFDRALATARAKGDRLHELTALNNRRRVWIAEKDVARAEADLRGMFELGRTLGLVLAELVGSYNLGELLYQAGDVDAAWPHVDHAVTLATRRADLQPRPVARLLELRLLAYEGRWQEVESLGAVVAEAHRSARAEGRSDAELLPSEEVLLDAVLLAATGAGTGASDKTWDEAWAALRARSAERAEEQHAIEVIELQALGALRVGDPAAARRALGEALELARRIPNVMEARLLQRLSQLDEPAPAP